MTEQLDLNQLRTFLAVHRSGSITAAGHLLGLSQSTVTTQIKALEARLGRELFERRSRGVVALPYADELATKLAAPLDLLAGLADRGPVAAPVHLAGPAEFLGTVGLNVLATLVADGVQLRVATGLTEPLLEELRAGRHDLVVATRRPRSRALVAEALADEEFVLVAAPVWAERLVGEGVPIHGQGWRAAAGSGDGEPDLRSAAGQPDRHALPDALAGIPLIAYAADLPIVRRYWLHVFDRRLTTQPALTFPDLRGVRTAVAAGAGWSVLPSYLCRDELASGALRLLHRADDPPINTAYLVRRPGGSANPHVALVRERLLAAGRAWFDAPECQVAEPAARL